MTNINSIIDIFRDNYQQRFSETEILKIHNEDGITTQFQIKSNLLKEGNYPTIFYHGKKTNDVIILAHGLSDSPYYMKAIGRVFYESGLNVLLPLMPAHGLKEPDKAMEDSHLDHKWRNEMERSVALAKSFGNRISLGGFSAGGALSYNFILRHPNKIQGGLFLFSAAIAVKLIKDVSRFIILKNITKMRDGKIEGIGKDPYKYPTFPTFGALELGDIIRENVDLSQEKKIPHPVFAAHSVKDKAAKIEGIIDLLSNHCTNGIAFLISDTVKHAELPLDQDITLDSSKKLGPKSPPKANPQFNLMMDAAIRFYQERIEKKPFKKDKTI